MLGMVTSTKQVSTSGDPQSDRYRLFTTGTILMCAPRQKTRLRAALLLASACLLAAACSGPVAGRPDGERTHIGDAPPPTQAWSREEPPKLYPVWVKDKIGFIDNTGRLVIPPKFEGNYVWGEFSDGMARVKVSTLERPGYCCRFGYINSEGRVVVEPQYWEAEDFSEGLAAVLMGDRWGYWT